VCNFNTSLPRKKLTVK